jgi:lysophospholipase L1-like esterase
MLSARGKSLLLFVAVCAGLPLLAECGARLAMARESGDLFDYPDMSDLERAQVFDPVLWWRLQPGLRDYPVRTLRDLRLQKPTRISRDFVFSTNAEGLRSPPLQPPGTRIRILAIGDSTTFGLGVGDHETWPAQLEALLNARAGAPRYAVINAGVIGYSSYQGLRYLEQRGLALGPALVIATFGNNDWAFWGSMPDRVKGEAWKVYEPGWWPPKLYGLFHFVRLSRPYADGQETPARPRLSEAEYAEVLRAMHARCASQGVPLLLIGWPEAAQIAAADPAPRHYQAITRRVAAEVGAVHLDLYAALLPLGQGAFLDEIHASAAGCRAVAETLAPVVARLAPVP